METSDLLRAPYAEQKRWLESLNVDFNEDLLCFILTFDEYTLQQWLEDPEEYSTGEKLKSVFSSLTAKREADINEGVQLSDQEIEHLKEAVWSHQIDNDDGLGGLNYMGHSVRCEDGSVFALFSGHSEGQGGVSWSFEGFYQSKQAAIINLKANLEENERYCPI